MTDKIKLNLNDVELMDFQSPKGKFKAKLGEVALPLGLKNIGCMLHIVNAGETAFPFHNHHNMDEMFVILSGTGEYRFGTTTHQIIQGDVLAAPAGGADKAHQIINTGTDELRYLGISDIVDTSVVEYPDSDKIAISSRMIDGDPRTAEFRFKTYTTNEQPEYFDGEE